MNNLILKEGEDTAKSSISNLLFLAFIKGVAGFITGMPVILADAISTLTDTLGLFAAYIGLKLSRKSADKNFAYGYYKFETFAALIISISIIYLAYVICLEGIKSLTSLEEGAYRPLAITTTVISIILSYKLAKELKLAAEKVNSLSLLASSKDKKIDMFSGFIVLVSIFANYKNIPYVEGVVTIMISMFIFKEGFFSTKESLFFLLDYWNNPILLHKIKRVFKHEHEIIKKINKIRLRRAGTFIFGEAFVDVNPFVSMEDLRDSLELLEKKVLDINPYIKDFSIHTHIPKSKKTRIAVPVKKGKSLQADVANTLTETEGYVFVDVSKNRINKIHYKKISPLDKQPLNFGPYLKKEKANILIDCKINSLIYYNLRRTNHILIYPNFGDIKKVKQTVQLLLIDT
ncbi:hypothetical protein COU74_02305 [Candidatus Peregrinibacteria bacterium CG10_big_fil_rev_8_21_14_0_10_36_19]|nr:MAG: hypothetical protein COU74_02305 [Candidatus Peregrinibacteria bacterium CG10_big_fil_rev_8_21_14_0_10_36_19]